MTKMPQYALKAQTTSPMHCPLASMVQPVTAHLLLPHQNAIMIVRFVKVAVDELLHEIHCAAICPRKTQALAQSRPQRKNSHTLLPHPDFLQLGDVLGEQSPIVQHE